MKKAVLILLSLLLFAAWGGGGELASIRDAAKAEVTIERLRKEKPVNWDAVGAELDKTMPLLKAADAAAGTTYEKEIPAALADCRAGKDAKVAQQVLAKGLQHAAVLYIQDNLGKLQNDSEAAAKTAACFEGIRPTLTRRDKDFFAPAKTLEEAADRALAALKDAGNGPGAWTAARELLDVLDRTYALSLLYEIQEIEKLRDKDLPECAVKKKEGEMFWRILSPRVQKSSPKAHETITAMLASDYGAMDSKAMKEALSQGLPGIKL